MAVGAILLLGEVEQPHTTIRNRVVEAVAARSSATLESRNRNRGPRNGAAIRTRFRGAVRESVWSRSVLYCLVDSRHTVLLLPSATLYRARDLPWILNPLTEDSSHFRPIVPTGSSWETGPSLSLSLSEYRWHTSTTSEVSPEHGLRKSQRGRRHVRSLLHRRYRRHRCAHRRCKDANTSYSRIVLLLLAMDISRGDSALTQVEIAPCDHSPEKFSSRLKCSERRKGRWETRKLSRCWSMRGTSRFRSLNYWCGCQAKLHYLASLVSDVQDVEEVKSIGYFIEANFLFRGQLCLMWLERSLSFRESDGFYHKRTV